MRTLGAIIGGITMIKGALILAAPGQYLRFWTREGMPDWVRRQASLWRSVPESALRQAAVGTMATGALMLSLATGCPVPREAKAAEA